MMDNRLIFRYRSVGVQGEHPGETEPLSGWRWQAVNDRDAGRKPEVRDTWGQEKLAAR